MTAGQETGEPSVDVCGCDPGVSRDEIKQSLHLCLLREKRRRGV